MKKLFLLAILSICSILMFVGPASASLMGDDVVITYNGSVNPSTVGSNVEYTYGSYFNVDVAASSITVSFNRITDFSTASGVGIGVLELTDDSGFALSGITGGADFSMGVNSVFFDLSNTRWTAGSSYTALLTFAGDLGDVDPVDIGGDGGDTGGVNTMANPVPAPILLLGTGLVGLAGFRRKVKK